MQLAPLVRAAALLIAVATIVYATTVQSDGYYVINFTIDWTGGMPSPACNSCTPASFACSDGRGAWNGGALNFMDPFQGSETGKTFLPIAVNLTITGYFNCDNSSFRQMYLLMAVRLSPSASIAPSLSDQGIFRAHS